MAKVKGGKRSSKATVRLNLTTLIVALALLSCLMLTLTHLLVAKEEEKEEEEKSHIQMLSPERELKQEQQQISAVRLSNGVVDQDSSIQSKKEEVVVSLSSDKAVSPSKAIDLAIAGTVPPVNTTTKKKRIRNKHNRTRLHKFLHNLTQDELRLERLDSVDYYACCGLGHRLTKNSDAYYVAKELNMVMKPFWGYCDAHTEVFSYLFGSPPSTDDTSQIEPNNRILQLRNEVPGMNDFSRNPYRNGSCVCAPHQTKFDRDLEYYQTLQRRFRFRDSVASFQQQHNFANHTVLGMHVRAGNNETGDFKRKKRGIKNMNRWVDNVSRQIEDLIQNESITNPLLYIATDTHGVISLFQAKFEFPVIDLPQERASEGVLFGEFGKLVSNGSQCLQGWVTAVTDMMLLSSADYVIAARPSSFVQSMPQAMALAAAANTNRTKATYCEISFLGNQYTCFHSMMDWCCRGSTVFALGGVIQGYEYTSMPADSWNISHVLHKFTKRREDKLVLPMEGSTMKKTELPYSWEGLVAF